MKRNERKGIGLALAVLALCGAGFSAIPTSWVSATSTSQSEETSANSTLNYISENDTVGNNLAALDSQAKTNADAIETINGKLSGVTIALGSGVSASENSIAIGEGASTARGYRATAIGYNALADCDYSIAIGSTDEDGFSTMATGYISTAVGHYSRATGNYSTALGDGDVAAGDCSTAVGKSNDVGTWGEGKRSTAVGYYNTVYANQATGLGNRNYVTGQRSTSVGSINAVLGSGSGAFGRDNTIGATDNYVTAIEGTGVNTYVVGSENTVTASNAFVFGSGVTTVADNSVVLGKEASAGGTSSTAIGYKANASGENAIAIGSYQYSGYMDLTTEATGKNAVAIGTYSRATGNFSTAVGGSNVAAGISSTAVGKSNDVGTEGGGKQSTAVGYYNTVYANQAVGVGHWNYVHGDRSSSVGSKNTVYGANSGAFGIDNVIGAEGEEANPVADKGVMSYAIGANNTVTANNAFVLGSGVSTVADNSVVLGVGSSSEDANTVSVGNAELQRKIVHVADGTAATDAATVGQLNTKVTELTSADSALSARITTNADAIDQINTNISGLSDLTETVGGHTTSLNTLTGRVDMAEGEIDTLQGTVGEHTTAIEMNADNIAKNKAAIEANDEELEALGETVGGHTSSLNTINSSINTINGSLESLSGALGTLSSEATYNYISSGNSVSANLAVLDTQIKLNETAIGENKTAIGNNATAIEGLDGRLDTAESDIDSLETTVGGHTSSISGLDTRVTKNASDISGLDGRLGTAEGKITAAETDIDNLQAALTGTSGLSSTVSGLAGRVGANESAIASNKSAIETNTSNIALNKTAIENVDAKIDSKIGTLKADEGETKAYSYLNSKNTVSQNLESLETAIKASTKGDDQNRVSIGNNSEVTGKDSTAIGTGVNIEGENSVAVGTGHQIKASNSGAFGDPSTISSDDSYAVGNNNTVTGGKNVFVLGHNVVTTSSDVVVLGNNSSTTQTVTGGSNVAQNNVVSVGSTDNLRRIINVADGVYSADAATFGQSVKNKTYTVVYGNKGSGTTGSVEVLTNDGQVAFTINGLLNAADAEAAAKGTLTAKDYTNYTGDNTTIAISDNNVISAKTGSVASGDKGLISGGAAYSELREGASGSYVSYDKTTAQNLSALDAAIGSNAAVETTNGYIANGASVNANLKALNAKAVVSGQEISAASGSNVIKAVDGSDLATISVGGIGENETGFVSGKSVYEYVNGIADNATIGFDNNGKLKALTGDVGDENATLVTGDAVYEAIKTAKDGFTEAIGTAKTEAINAAAGDATTKADNALAAAKEYSNAELAKLISYNSADGGVITIGSSNAAATSVNFGNRILSGVAAGKANTDAANVGQLLASGTYTVDTATGSVTIQTKDKSSSITINGMKMVESGGQTVQLIDYSGSDTISVDSKTKVISANTTGGIGDGNTNLVTGDQVYDELRPTNGAYVKKGETTATNLNALDAAVKANADQIGTILTEKIGTIDAGTYNAIDASASVSDNLVALDQAVKASAVSVSSNKSASVGSEVTVDTSATNATAIGSKIEVSAKDSTAIGTGITVKGENSVAVGKGHKVYGNNSGAFGDPNNVYGSGSYAAGNEITIGDANQVNQVGNNTFVFGNKVTTTANNAVILGNESTATEDNVVSVGAAGKERKIVNVKAGENDTDAVNVAQLKEAMQGSAVDVNQALGTLDSRINDVAAGAAALAALHPTEYDPNDKLSFAVGYGHYKNANAGAIGAFFQPNEDVTVSLGSTFGNGNPMVNAGVSFKLGRRGEKMAEPDAKMIRALKTENASQAEEIAGQAKKIETLEANNARQEKEIEELRAQIAKVLEKMELSDTVQKSAAAH